jgi:hypothetical protein
MNRVYPQTGQSVETVCDHVCDDAPNRMGAGAKEREESSIPEAVSHLLQSKFHIDRWIIISCLRKNEEGTAPSVDDHMKIRISAPAYKIVYEAGSEDMVRHEWGHEEEEMRARARQRDEERKRSIWLRHDGYNNNNF